MDTFDVVIVGSGPGGSSAATFCARKGLSTVFLDKEDFPRDKVCGDGLTPQAIYWLDELGCVDEVLGITKSCIKTCDLYLDGQFLLTGGFPQESKYPDFVVLLDRRRFDHLLMLNACQNGAEFRPHHKAVAVEWEKDGAVVVCRSGDKTVRVKGRVVIGADGVSSVVSRAIGNTLKNGVTAVSLRSYYSGVSFERSPIKVYFDREYFPGYGWIFIDDEGFANVGLGYAFDNNFPVMPDLRKMFRKFIERDLGGMLAGASQCGRISGGSASFYKPRSIVADRVMLIGDAANQTDPLNGGGIHKAMEGAYAAAEAAARALATGDFSRQTLQLYENLWSDEFELDRRSGELLLSIAKNPHIREFSLFVLENIGKLTVNDRRFQDFCAGVFSGVIAQSACLSPAALMQVIPRDVHAWFSLLKEGEKGHFHSPLGMANTALSGLSRVGYRMAADPLTNLDWGLEVLTKAVQWVDYRLGAEGNSRTVNSFYQQPF
ncbi:MAG: geranylgeranyl reductase family protein [Calditrichaeota bacterium]|nr:geranylgeranyl reductase family protein [Calditrichota bacterium]HQU71779.1 geranylgeranyl reductase family protein [Calditrichia bacterium]